MANHDLLIELGCEELPPKALDGLAQAFFQGVVDGLGKAQIDFDLSASRPYASPRRLAIYLSAVADQQPDQTIERKGPAVSAAFDQDDQPTQAAMGFARSVGKEVSDLSRLKTDQGEWLYYEQEQKGKALGDVLYPVLEQAIKQLPIPKPMRWADHEFSFIRPVHWLLVMHGDEVVPGELFGHQANRLTRGHRIHSSGTHSLKHCSHYVETLKQAHVLADQNLRRETVKQQAEQAGQALGHFAQIDEDLLDEVNNLVEWPIAISCAFDEDFLQVPQEALIASMQDHQKFFPVVESQDNPALTQHFVAMANLESQNPAAVQEGFERVIRPRLADAQFFWEQDKKQSLEAFAPALEKIVFQKQLGTVADKSRRVAALAKQIADDLGEDSVAVCRAAVLAKCDLVTQMVGEFPELQGVMGKHYALASGEPKEVAEAINEHYAPRFAGDEIPSNKSGQILALAERLDTLVGIFSIGLKPTGNKDPFALRRAALGIVRILTEANLPLTLDTLIKQAANTYDHDLPSDCEQQCLEFILDRLRQHLQRDYSADLVHAVLAAPLSSLPDLNARSAALAGFMDKEEASSLAAANKRIGNILKKADFSESVIDADGFIIDEEKHLFAAVSDTEAALAPLLDSQDYPKALNQLAALRPTVDAFFDHVMVMDEDLEVRNNRLALLQKLKGLFDRIADISYLG